MEFDNDLVVGKLRRWEKYLAAYRLPAWEQIPDLGLYMEQVVLLLRQYLDYLPPELKQPEPITAAAINNYVRTRLLPEPRKKRYYRVHIAYLIMICTLKQALRLSELQTLLPGDLPEDEVRRTYDAYVRRHQLCAQYFIDHQEDFFGAAVGTAILRMLHQMSRIFRENAAQPAIYAGMQIDKKRRRRLQEKRMAMGHKADDHEDRGLTQQTQ